jgi:hypothetical protein
MFRARKLFGALPGEDPWIMPRDATPTHRISRENAEDMAVAALGFLAADDERLSRFLALSGLDPARLRETAAEPGFLPGVMAHLASDEALLLQFSAESGRRPEEIAAACAMLAGPGEFG